MFEGVQQLLASFPELLNEFETKAFHLIEEERPEEERYRKSNKHQYPTRCAPLSNNVQEKIIDGDSSGSEIHNSMDDEKGFLTKLKYIMKYGYDDLIKVIYLYIEGTISIHEVESLVQSMFSKSQEDDLSKLILILKSRERNRRGTNWFCKSLTELLNNKARIGSFIKYPDDHLRVVSPLQHPLMNSIWCSLPTGSEDTSFRILRKNEFEDKLFKCEDDIYESDMNISIYTSSIETMETIKKTVEQKDRESIDPKLFQPAKLAAIYMYYNERADEVIEFLHSKPLKTVETILPKLKQKLEMHLKQNQDNSKHWVDICTKNYSKSLDHRSFYFKQNEKRHIHSKFFLQDIKIRSTERQKQCLNILKGGCTVSPFYISFSALQQPLDEFIIPNDEIADLTEEEVRKNMDKLPHYQLLFNDEECFSLSINIIVNCISLINNRQQEKDKMIGFLSKLFEHFFGAHFDIEEFKPTIVEEDDTHIIITDEFKRSRCTHHNQPFESILNSIKSGKEDKTERSAPKPLKPCRGVLNTRINNEENGKSKPINIERQVCNDLLPPKTPERKLLFGSQHIYCLLRFFHVLYERLIKIRKLIKDQFISDYSRINPEGQISDEMQSLLVNETFMGIFISVFTSLVKGRLEVNKFEDFCKNYMGQKAYLVFTLDKLVNSIIKILQQHLIGDDLSQSILELFIQNTFTDVPNSDLYLYRFNKIVLETNNQANTMAFRLLYDQAKYVLSIHLLNSVYSKMDSKVLNSCKEYVKV